MTTPQKTVWPLDPHTAAKHQLLRHYLERWSMIILESFKTATYLEGFAGPGIYEGGEPGSPVIAYEQIALALTAGKGWSARVGLIEEDHDRVVSLREQMDTVPRLHREIKVEYREGRCADKAEDLLTSLGAFGRPIFAFLDSFSGSDVPFSLVKRIASNQGSEVLVTFGPRFLTQFGTVDIHAAKGDAVFGSTEWRQVVNKPSNEKRRFLVDTYRHKSLPAAGFKHSLAFEMRDERGHSLWLIFGTTHERGLEKMKEAMWKVDPYQGLRYVDAADPQQIAMDITVEPDTSALKREILDRVRSEGPEVSVARLRDFVLQETIYKPTQVLGMVRELINEKRLVKTSGPQLQNSSTIALAPAGTQPAKPKPKPEQLTAF